MSEANGERSVAGLAVELDAFSYPGAHPNRPLLSRVSIAAPAGGITVIMGRSGCGKTTLLRLISGIEREPSLKLYFEGKAWDSPNSQIGLVFQDYRLFPWKNVEQNIIAASEVFKQDLNTVSELIYEFNLAKLRNAWPKTLSGGEQARVALARCMVQKPKVLLLDEVFRSLDLQTRIGMFEAIARLTLKDSLVTIAVTHDVDEARRIAHNVIILKGAPATVWQMFRRDDGDVDGKELEKRIAVALTSDER